MEGGCVWRGRKHREQLGTSRGWGEGGGGGDEGGTNWAMVGEGRKREGCHY